MPPNAKVFAQPSLMQRSHTDVAMACAVGRNVEKHKPPLEMRQYNHA